MLQALDGEEVYGLDNLEKPFDNYSILSAHLLSFKSAAQTGLKTRRQLVLAVLSAWSGPHLPADILQHICKLAELVVL